MNMQISEVLFYMAPATLVAFIADLDAHMAVAPDDGRVDWMMRQALSASSRRRANSRCAGREAGIPGGRCTGGWHAAPCT